MFMEADVPNEPAAPAPATPEPQPMDAVPEAPGGQSGASDSKGWTVFMERQPIAPPPGYTGPTPSYAPTPAELAATMEQPAQPPMEEPAQPVAPAAVQPGVSKQTVVMDRAPDVAPPGREASMSSVPASVPSTPAIETGGPPRTQQPLPSQLPAQVQSRDLDRPAKKNMLPVAIGVGVVAVILIILIIVIAAG
jgi:hypothetical protein